ncbi:MAG: DUF3618 domain-containing protein [Dermatophilaceae bacterium]
MTDTSASSAPASDGPAPSISALEAEIGARRERLATSIDELVTRASPRNVLHRQADAARARFSAATRTPEGSLRADRVAAVTAVVVVVGGIVIYRRLRRR